MAVDPIEVVLYLTARDATYGILGNISNEFQKMGNNLAALGRSFQSQEEASARAYTSMMAVSQADNAVMKATQDLAASQKLAADGIDSVTEASIRQVAAADAAAAAVARYHVETAAAQQAASQGDVALANVHSLNAAHYGAQAPMLAAQASQAADTEAQARDLASSGRLAPQDANAALMGEQAALTSATNERAIAERNLGDVMTGTGNIAKSIAVPALVGVGLGLTALAVVSEKQAVAFDAEMARVRALGDTSLTDTQLSQLSNQVLNMAPSTGQGPDSVAGGEYFVASAGFSGQQALSLTQVAAQDATTAGLKDMTGAASALTSALLAYGHDKSESDANLAASAKDFNDALITGVTISKAEFSDFARSIGTALAPSALLGVSFPEVVAMGAQLTQHGISARESFQDIGSLEKTIVSPPAKSRQFAEDLGVPTGPNAIKSMPGLDKLTEYLQMVDQAAGGNIQVVQAILGNNARAMRVYENTIGSDNGASFTRQALDPMANRAGAGEQAFADFMKSNAGEVMKAESELSTKTINLGKEFEGMGDLITTNLMPGLSNLISLLTQGTTPGSNSGVGNFMGGLGNIMDRTFSAHAQGASSFGDLFSPLTTQRQFNKAQQDYLGNVGQENRLSGADTRYLADGGANLQALTQMGNLMLAQVTSALKDANPVAAMGKLMAQDGGQFAATYKYLADRAAPQVAADQNRAAFMQTMPGAGTFAHPGQSIDPRAPGVPFFTPEEEAARTADPRGGRGRRGGATEQMVAAAQAIIAGDQQQQSNVAAWASGVTQKLTSDAQAGLQNALDTGNWKGANFYAKGLESDISHNPNLSKQEITAQQRTVARSVTDAEYQANLTASEASLKSLAASGGSIDAMHKAMDSLDQLQLNYAKSIGNKPGVLSAQAEVDTQNQLYRQGKDSIAVGAAGNKMNYDQATGASLAQQMSDLAAQKSAALAQARDASGSKESIADGIKQVNNDFLERYAALNNQMLAQQTDLAQVQLDAVNTHHGTQDQQRAALQQWEGAVMKAADVAAGKDPNARIIGEGKVRNQSDAEAQRIYQEGPATNLAAAKLNYDTSMRMHDSSAQQWQAYTLYAQAVDKQVASLGLHGADLKLAQAQAQDTKNQAKQPIYQQEIQDKKDLLDLDEKRHANYADLIADAQAIVNITNKDGRAAGMSATQIAIANIDTLNQVKGDARNLNRPTYVDRQAIPEVGNLDVSSFGSTAALFASMRNGGGKDNTQTLMETIASLQKQLAAKTAEAARDERMLTALNGIKTNTDDLAPGHLPTPTPWSKGVTARASGAHAQISG